MIKSKDEIESAVSKYLKSIVDNKEKREQIINFMTNKGFTKGYVTKMLNLNQLPEMWADMDLGVMLLAINEIGGLNISDYYTEKEIDIFQRYQLIAKKSVDEPIVFENAFPTGYFSDIEEPTQFIAAQVPIQMIYELFRDKKIGYNPEIQRDLILYKTKKGEVIEKINAIPAKKKEIAEKTLRHEMFANAITLNVMNTGKQEVKYNWDSHRLIIENNEDTEVFIIDGYNRVVGFNYSIEKDSDVKFYIPVTICIFDKERASQTIADIDKQTPISKGKAKVLNASNPFMDITKRIGKIGTNKTNEMYARLAEDNNELKFKKEKYCTYETISEAIKYNFFDDSNKNVTPRKIDNTAEFVIKGFNELIGILKEKYDTDDLTRTSEKSVCVDNNIFIGYIALLSNIQNSENWKSILEKTINGIDFSRSNKEWEFIEVSSNRINKSIIKKISNYFIERSVR